MPIVHVLYNCNEWNVPLCLFSLLLKFTYIIYPVGIPRWAYVIWAALLFLLAVVLWWSGAWSEQELFKFYEIVYCAYAYDVSTHYEPLSSEWCVRMKSILFTYFEHQLVQTPTFSGSWYTRQPVFTEAVSDWKGFCTIQALGHFFFSFFSTLCTCYCRKWL